MTVTQAVILAGGKGTRLEKVSGGLPKPLVPVAGVPVIVHQIKLLSRYGVKRVFITTGFKADELSAALGDGSRWGVILEYVHEEEPLGTAGGVAALAGHLQGDFFVLYGDVLVNMDLVRLAVAHLDKHADATIVVHPNDHPYDSDLVACGDDNRITKLFAYPRSADVGDLPNLVSAALYVLSDSVFEYIDSGSKQDFIRDVFPRMSLVCRLFAYPTTEYLKDMGTPDRLQKVEKDIQSGKVKRLHADYRRPVLFLDRDGVLNEEVNGVTQPDALRLIPGAAAAVALANRAGWLVAVVTNQPAIAKGFMTEGDLKRVHNRLETLLGEQSAWIDVLEYCPHHPEVGHVGERPELKVECNCRKPNPGLLQQAAKRIPADLSCSVMIGDHWRDVVAARRFGLDAIAVRTGHGYRDVVPAEYVSEGVADLVVEDLEVAVRVLLEEPGELDHIADRIVAAKGQEKKPGLITFSGGNESDRARQVFQLRQELRARGMRCRAWSLDGWHGNTELERQYPISATANALLRNELVQLPDTRSAMADVVEESRTALIRLKADVLILHGQDVESASLENVISHERTWTTWTERNQEG